MWALYRLPPLFTKSSQKIKIMLIQLACIHAYNDNTVTGCWYVCGGVVRVAPLSEAYLFIIMWALYRLPPLFTKSSQKIKIMLILLACKIGRASCRERVLIVDVAT